MAHLAALRKELSDAADLVKEKKADADPRREPMSRLLKGLLPAHVYCPTASDILRALDLAETYKFKAKLILGRDGWKAAARSRKGVDVVIDRAGVLGRPTRSVTTRSAGSAPGAASQRPVRVPDGGARAVQRTGYLWYQAASSVAACRAPSPPRCNARPAEILGLGAASTRSKKGRTRTFVPGRSARRPGVGRHGPHRGEGRL
jgi:hypothetical protein